MTTSFLRSGGEKTGVIAVLMSDLRGFTAMGGQIDPQTLITVLNHYLGEMTEIIERYGGTIIEFVGDGILAIFGAPIARQDHAASAVAAAIEMQGRMESVNLWNREQGYPELEMGIGVNSGEAIVGNVGSEKRTRYNVIGSSVNLCGRVESCSVGGQLFCKVLAKRGTGWQVRFTAKPLGFGDWQALVWRQSSAWAGQARS